MFKKHSLITTVVKDAATISGKIIVFTKDFDKNGEFFVSGHVSTYDNDSLKRMKKEQGYIPHHLHVISNEKLVEGDFKYCSFTNEITQYDKFANEPGTGKCEDCRKIVASTDKTLNVAMIPYSLLEHVCVFGITDLLFEYESSRKFGMLKPECYPQILKLAQDKTIKFKPIKTNFTLEDMYKAYQQGRTHEYEAIQFVPDGRKECKFIHPKESFEEWINNY